MHEIVIRRANAALIETASSGSVPSAEPVSPSVVKLVFVTEPVAQSNEKTTVATGSFLANVSPTLLSPLAAAPRWSSVVRPSEENLPAVSKKPPQRAAGMDVWVRDNGKETTPTSMVTF